MQQPTWILVANACEAKLYQNTKRFGPLHLLEHFQHPRSRNKNSDIATDRSGAFRCGGTSASGSMVEATRPKDNEAKRFAMQLAETLDGGRATHAYYRLIVVATPPFLGLLNAQFNSKVRKLVRAELKKDYTGMAERELLPALQAQNVL